MQGKQLVRMIAFVVREELKKQLRPMIESVLTEQYLRRVVTESRPTRRVVEAESYEDHIPEQEPMDDGGIYHEDQPNTRLRQPTNEHVRKLLSPENPFAALYEGVSPVPSATEQASVGEVPLNLVQKKLGVDFERMRELAGQKKQVVQEEAPAAARRHRPEWDQVVDTRPEHERTAPAVKREVRAAMAPAHRPLNPMNADSAAFPDKPISFDE